MPDLKTILAAKTPLTLAGVPAGSCPWLLADLARAAPARAVFDRARRGGDARGRGDRAAISRPSWRC